MLITKKKFQKLEKKVADLEVQVQSQLEVIKVHISYHEEETKELRTIYDELKKSII